MKILILSPHPDDAEICMGGTIAKLVDQGHDLKVLFFSDCDIYRVRCEIDGSMKILGVKRWYLLSYPRQTMDNHRHEIRHMLFEDRQKGYERVYCPHPRDHHQDHRVIGEVATNVFGNSELIYYIWHKNLKDFNSSLFSELSEEELQRKLAALNCYRSQIKLHPEYFNAESIRATAIHYGTMISSKYAEVFHPYRMRHS